MVFERRLDNFEIVFCYSKTEGIFLGFIKFFIFIIVFLFKKMYGLRDWETDKISDVSPWKVFKNFNYLLPSAAGAKLAETWGLGMGEWREQQFIQISQC